jgi:hypothetical protein
MAASQIVMIAGIVHSLITAGQPFGVSRVKHRSEPLSGRSVDCFKDGSDQLLWRLGFGAENVIGIGSKFAEFCKGIGVLRQA